MRTDWISFLTDYGNYDGFVAACHGVIGSIAPAARVVDITHDVPPGDIRRGAVVLAQTVPYLPAAVHVAVVDPGVGTGRRAVALQAPGGMLVGPDNGLLGWAAEVLGGVQRAVVLTNQDFHRRMVSTTFHGRDIFAPVAAHLAAGATLRDVGEPIEAAGLTRQPEPALTVAPGVIDCEVLTVDRFGNVQTCADAAAVAAAGLRRGELLRLASGEDCHRLPYDLTFAGVRPDQLLCYLDSAGYLSIAVNGANAAGRLRLRPGDPVRISRGSDRPPSDRGVS